MIGNTAKYWILANTNYLLIAIYMILSGAAFIADGFHPGCMDLSLFLTICPALAGFSFRDKSVLVNILIALFGGVYVMSFGDDALTLILLVSFVSGAVLSIPIARFANRNFDEIVSRRMRWRSSNVVLFEERWKYVINRYVVCTFGICSIMFYLLSVPYSMSHPDLIHQLTDTVEQRVESPDNSE